jgi:hypothetical protein
MLINQVYPYGTVQIFPAVHFPMVEQHHVDSTAGCVAVPRQHGQLGRGPEGAPTRRRFLASTALRSPGGFGRGIGFVRGAGGASLAIILFSGLSRGSSGNRVPSISSLSSSTKAARSVSSSSSFMPPVSGENEARERPGSVSV